MDASATRRRKYQKEKVKLTEENIEIYSFLTSFIVHTTILLILSCLYDSTISNKRIVVSLSFNDSSSESVGVDMETPEINLPEIQQPSQNSFADNETIEMAEPPTLSVELSNDIQEQNNQKSLLEQVSLNDLNKTIITETNSMVQASSDNVLTELIKTTTAGIVAQNTMARSSRTASYTGKTGDDITKRLSAAGAKSGDVQISIAWDTVDDIDLHVSFTSGNGLVDHINFMNRVGQRSGGMLDIDMNANNIMLNPAPVENVFWPKNGAPKGYFMVYIHFYRSWTGNSRVPIRIRIKCGDKISDHEINAILGRSPQEVTRFTFPSDLTGYKF